MLILFTILSLALSGVQKTLSRSFASMRGVFVGSGSEGLQQPEVIDQIVSLTNKENSEDITVLYIGTATYDLAPPQHAQTHKFSERGCNVDSLTVSKSSDRDEMAAKVDKADVIVVSGGNTLYAIDLWEVNGLASILRDCAQRDGAVLCGGSAGAICWFTAGHSDSGDPATYREAMIAEYTAKEGEKKDESSDFTGEKKPWSYVRVPCLGILGGLVCPHFDKTQSNGILRAHDFDTMMLRHRKELGICIDHFAAIVLNGDASYSILSLTGRPGSVLPDGTFSEDRQGKPGVWTKRVQADDNTIVTQLVPFEGGQVADLVALTPQEDIVEDARLDAIRIENPIM